jgi:hypothetical protein
MNKLITLLILILIFSRGEGQNWTPPVIVSPLDHSVFPDMAVDSTGVIHVVWREDIESNFRKIMYAKSIDDGQTWSTPFDLSQNNDTACSQPHIVAGSDSKLYVTWDFNMGNPYQTYVHMKIFDGNEWGPTIVVSENLPASHSNLLAIDHENRVYVFWYRGYKFVVRKLINSTWSGFDYPYEDDHFIIQADVDAQNILHCIGSYTYSSKESYSVKIYFTYNPVNDQWSDVQVINEDPVIVGGDISTDSYARPHFVWSEHITNSWPWVYGTFYCRQAEPFEFSEKELILGYGGGAIIHIDQNDVINIFLSTSFDDVVTFKHFYKNWNSWQVNTIDSSYNEFGMGSPCIAEFSGKLYAVYFKASEDLCEIRFTKSDLMTNISKVTVQNADHSFSVYPNPFTTETIIQFALEKESMVMLRIYDLVGKSIVSLVDKKLTEGKHTLTWNGIDSDGNQVGEGIYFVRLSTGETEYSHIVYYREIQ